MHDSDLDKSIQALYMIKIDGNNAYKQALDIVDSEVRQEWETALKEKPNKYKDTAKDFAMFLYFISISHCISQMIQYKNLEAIKEQLMGAAFSNENLLNLTKYETALDRKFQSILSTLIKLQEIWEKRSFQQFSFIKRLFVNCRIKVLLNPTILVPKKTFAQ